MNLKLTARLIAISILTLVGCAGQNATYGPSTTGGNTQTGPTPDWTFQLAPVAAKVVKGTTVANPAALTDLGTLVPGQTVAGTGVLAVALNGYSGTVNLSDVASTAPDHIPAVLSVGSVSPTVSGAPFSVSVTVPPNYTYPGSGVTFQGSDGQGHTHQATITFKVSTVTASFAAATFANTDLTDSAPLSIAPVNGFTGPLNVAFDTTNAGITVPTGYSAFPAGVSVSFPAGPYTVPTAGGTSPVKFNWTTWSPGNYCVTAVLTKGTLAVRVPVLVTVTAGQTQTPPVAANLTWQYDSTRRGANGNETILTQANVNASQFGPLFQQRLDAVSKGQPLYVPNVMVNGAVHNVVYVATENNSVYAFDADNATGTNSNALWHMNLGGAPAIGTEDAGNEPLDGILSTPVISLNSGATNSGTLYVCAKTTGTSAPAYSLHGLDITTGAETAGGPVTVSASVTGANGTVTLAPKNSYQRPGLLLLNGSVYVAIGGQYGDPAPDRGWILGYNATNLQQQTALFNSNPSGSGGSIWMGSGALVSDGASIFAASGNGFAGTYGSGSDYADSVIKLTPSLVVTSFYTPQNVVALDQSDLDLGSSCPVLLPSGGSGQNVVLLSKDGNVRLLNASNLGGYNGTTDTAVQDFHYATAELIHNPAYYNGVLYFAGNTSGDFLNALSYSNGSLSPAALAKASLTGYLGTPTVSYNAAATNPASTAVVWGMDTSSSATVLRAFTAGTLTQLYSGTVASGENGANQGVPCVMNGKVYVPAGSTLAVFGPLVQTQLRTKKKVS